MATKPPTRYVRRFLLASMYGYLWNWEWFTACIDISTKLPYAMCCRPRCTHFDVIVQPSSVALSYWTRLPPSRSSRIKRLTLDAAGFSATKGGCQISCGENHQWTTRFPGNGKHSNPFLVMFGGWFMVLFSSNIVTIFDVDRLEHVGCLIVDGVLGWWSMWENCSKFEFGTSRSRNIILETDLTITCSNYINIFYKVVPPPCIKLVDNPHELYRYNPLKPQL